jgi:hypothetical protein
MQETPKPEISRELASRGDMLPVRAEDPIVVVQHRPGPHPALYLLVGLVIGASGTVIAVNSRPSAGRLVARGAQAPARVSVPLAPRVGAQTINPAGAAEPLPPTPGTPAGEAIPSGAVAQANPNEPVNPFSDGMVLPSLPVPSGGSGNPLRGMILPRRLPTFPSAPPALSTPPADGTPPPAVQPGNRKPNPLDSIVAKGLPAAPPALKIDPNAGKSDAKVVTVKSMPVSANAQQTAQDLIAYAGKIGGRAHALTEKGDGDKTVVRGVQATVPDKAVPDLLKYATSIGASMIDKSTWSGDSAERSQRLAQEAESRLASLKKLREALLVTYLEDAQPVKEVDGEIAEAQKAVDEAKTGKTPEKMSVVKFAFVGK